MKKILNYITIFLVFVATSCSEDFLDLAPQDQISDPEFWKTDNDLQLYLNNLYSTFPGWSRAGTGFSYIPDNGTDIAIYTHKSDRLDGTGNVPSSGGGWSWGNIHNVNYFLENVNRVTGDLKDHYKGEGYFFRAWFYFSLFQQFGELPIVDKSLNVDDVDYLYSSRVPRNEVADFILNDLDSAIVLMKTKQELPAMRLNKDIALLFKARVALYEGSWEKYHNGTVFGVSGANPDKYFQQAMDAANQLMEGGRYSLYQGDPSRVYYDLFNQIDYSKNPEVLFWKQYNYVELGNSFGNDLMGWPNRAGITREMVQSYLCEDGLPTAVSPLYKGDTTLSVVTLGRDPRCVQSVMVPGDVYTIDLKGDTTFYENPDLTDNNYCPTGYEWEKFRRPYIDPRTGSKTKDQGFIIFRYAEGLLIYAEAKAELGTLTQADLDISINLLRDRVGMPHMVLGSITPDPNWRDYGYSLPDYLYEIRRERQVELLGEGRRFNDLMRWRAHSLIIGKRPKGTKYTDDLRAINANMPEDADGYLDPYQSALSGVDGGYGFNPDRDYLKPIPSNEITLNENLTQNPGW